MKPFSQSSLGPRILKVVTVIVLTGLTVSCQTGPKPDNRQGQIHLRIDPGNLPPIVKLSELVKEVRLVPLETNPSCLIGHTNFVFAGEKSILISTADENGELFRFTPGGRFLHKIGSQGQGPGEYTDINSLSVFEQSSRAYIHGWRMHKIMEYSIEGELIREIPFGKGLSGPVVLDPERVAFVGYQDYEVKIVNIKTLDTSKYIKILPETVSQVRSLSGSPETGYYYAGMGRDTVFKIEGDSLLPFIVCDFGSGHYSSADYMKSVIAGEAYAPGKLSLSPIGTISGQDYIHFQLLRQNDQKEYIYARVFIRKETGQSYHLEQSRASDDILFCTSTDFRTVAANGEWVSVVGAYELIDALPQIKTNTGFLYNPEMIKQIEKLTIEDNPVLVYYTFK